MFPDLVRGLHHQKEVLLDDKAPEWVQVLEVPQQWDTLEDLTTKIKHLVQEEDYKIRWVEPIANQWPVSAIILHLNHMVWVEDIIKCKVIQEQAIMV